MAAKERTAGHRHRLRKRAVCLLAALVFALSAGAAPAAAAGTARTPVRAGYFYNGDFMHKADDGTYAGYDIEYYYELAGYANWDVQFVEYDSLQAAQAALAAGDIDVMSGLSITPERQSAYLVSAQKMCTTHIAVQTRADDDRFSAGDAATMADMTCGILKGSNVVKLYEDWCAQNGLAARVREYDTIQQRNAALSAGEVDAIAAGSTIVGAQKIAEFPGLDLYFMLNRGQTQLKNQLDRAMSMLSLQEPTYAGELFQQYFPLSRNTAPSFSAAEKAYLAAHPTLRVAVLQNDAPFSDKAADGTMRGILPDYFAHLSQMTGAAFVCVPVASKEAARTALAAGEADLIGRAEDDIFAANESGLLLTAPYLTMNMVMLTRAGTAHVERAAVPQCSAAYTAKVLAQSGQDVKTSACENSEKCFAALKTGQTDAVICTQPAATWLLNRNRASDYVVTAFGGGTWDVTCALPGGADGNTLRAILNKTIAVDSGAVSQIITSATLQDSASLAGVFDRLPVSAIAMLACVALALFLVCAAALLVLVRRRKTERQLAARQAELAAAMETAKARHAFFGTISHDMRTPLNGIVGFTDLALASSDPVRIREYLTKIRASGAILSSLVNDTLIMSRVENGKYVLKPTPCDTRALLQGVLEPVRMQAAAKGVHFEDNTAALPPRRVLADRLSMQKVLLNLLTNAVKFTPAGGTVTLECRLEPPAGAAPDTVITVRDTGVGIAPAFLPHVFEPFAQEDPANTQTAGSGMGLPIVKSIVDAMGGTVTVKSEKGRGSTFTVRLHLTEAPAEASDAKNAPAADGRAPADAPALSEAAAAADAAPESQTLPAAAPQHEATPDSAVSADAPPAGTPAAPAGRDLTAAAPVQSAAPEAEPAPAPAAAPALAGLRVLVCEDNALNLEIMRAILEQEGACVESASNGRAGADAFAASAPGSVGCVLLDLRMPVMDGRAAARAIRALNRPDARTVPIVAVSADAYPENVQECLDAGMNAHIAKPVDAQALVRLLRQLCR